MKKLDSCVANLAAYTSSRFIGVSYFVRKHKTYHHASYSQQSLIILMSTYSSTAFGSYTSIYSIVPFTHTRSDGMDLRVTLFFFFIGGCSNQIFQYFIVNNKEKTTKVIDTIKLPTCTHLDQKDNVTLRGGIKSGKFTKHGVVKDMKTCIDECCRDESCDVAFMPGSTCYTVKCYSQPLCESIPAIPSDVSLGSVQISHIIRNGGKGDDVDEFRKTSGVNRNSLPNGDKCLFSRVAYNQTIYGGKDAGEIIDLGKVIDIHNCAQKCCQHENCEVAVVRENTCYAIDCFTKELCDSRAAPSIGGVNNMLVYMNERNGKRQTRSNSCGSDCINGICANEDLCLCDVGIKGEHCHELETVGNCDPVCGAHGKCNPNDTCQCDPEWEGYKCDRQIICKPLCENGICAKDGGKVGKCTCEFGWMGTACNETNGDKLVLASSGEEVLFTEAEIEPELDIKIPEAPPMHGTESISALVVAICCGIAAAVLGAAAVMFIAKQILGKRAISNYEYLNNIPENKGRGEKR